MYLRTQGRLSQVHLGRAQAGHLVDAEDSWPAQGKLNVEEFVYGGFTDDAPRDARQRLKWLALQSEFAPQSYEQLTRVYKQVGDDAAARKVSVAREWRRFRRGRLGASGTAANLLLGTTIGYGYRPGRAVYFLIALYLLGALLVYPHSRDVMVATNPTPKTAVITASNPCPPNYTCYSPWAYSFDVLVPIIHLGQTAAWSPTGRSGSMVRYFSYIMTVLGWALATMAVAGFTGLVRKL